MIDRDLYSGLQFFSEVAERGQELFGVDYKSIEAALKKAGLLDVFNDTDQLIKLSKERTVDDILGNIEPYVKR